MEERRKPGGEVMIAVLDCPGDIKFTMKRFCADSAADAEAQAKKAVDGKYACQPGCELLVNARAEAPGKACVIQLEPEVMGKLYDVKITISCR